MAESMDTDEGPIRHLLPVDSIKMMGESIGIANMKEDVAVKVSEDLEYRLKELIQDAAKFMRHSKRKKLACLDIDNALKVKNVEPLYGFDTSEYIPFRHTSGGGKDLYYPDEKDINLLDLVNAPLPRLPCDVTMKAHWLCVDGVQPIIPENPAPQTIDDQRNEALGTSLPVVQSSEPISHVRQVKYDRKMKKSEENMSTEWSKLKPLQAHALSLEQQLYYKEITDACMGIGSDTKCQEALGSLASDPGLYQLLPQFMSYINEGIKVNVGQRKLVVLKQLLKMVLSLLENTSLSLEKYLHELIPSVLTCLINKQVCVRPEAEDHWSLRDMAAKILAKNCKKYGNSVNNIQPRLTRIYSQALKNTTLGLGVHYGAMIGLIELGQDSISSLVIPRLKQESTVIRLALGQSGKIVEQVAAKRLQSLLTRYCAPILMTKRSVSDTLAQYQADYGHIGQDLFNQVKTLRANRAGLQSTVTARVTTGTPTLKSPTSFSILKNKPPPLSLSSLQVAAIRGSTIPKSPVITSLSSPTIAAALQLVTQAAATRSNPGTPTSASSTTSSGLPAVNLLSAVMSNPSAQALLAEHLSAALSGNSSTATGSNGKSPSPKTPITPNTPQGTKSASEQVPKTSS